MPSGVYVEYLPLNSPPSAQRPRPSGEPLAGGRRPGRLDCLDRHVQEATVPGGVRQQAPDDIDRGLYTICWACIHRSGRILWFNDDPPPKLSSRTPSSLLEPSARNTKSRLIVTSAWSHATLRLAEKPLPRQAQELGECWWNHVAVTGSSGVPDNSATSSRFVNHPGTRLPLENGSAGPSPSLGIWFFNRLLTMRSPDRG
jgi:hypothetical protein